MEQKFELTPGYRINRVLNGCWQISAGHDLTGTMDMSDVKRAFYELYDAGFTTFDCGDIYTGAEEFIGEFVNELRAAHRYDPDGIQVHTKYVPDLDKLADVDFEFTQSIIDRSLKRLNREILDMVQFHWWDYDVPGCIETAGHLVRLKEAGKIRNIGVTNFDTAHLKELVDAGIPVVSMQAQYSVFDRRPDRQMVSYCKANNIRLICYGVLAGGFISEKYMGMTEPGSPETRSQVKYMQVIEDSLGWDGYQELLGIMHDIGLEHGVKISQVAANYILGKDNVAGCMIGVRNSRHVADNKAIFSFDLTAGERARIDEFIGRYPTVEGEPFEQERTIGSKYREIMHMNVNKEEQS